MDKKNMRTSKDKKDFQNSKILSRTLSERNSASSGANRVPSNVANRVPSTACGGHSSTKYRDAAERLSQVKEPESENMSEEDPEGMFARCLPVRRGLAAQRAAMMQSVDIDEDKPPPLDGPAGDMDPAQALLSQHRLAAFLASPDYDSSPTPPGGNGPLVGGNGPGDTTRLPIGRCCPQLAEEALQSAGTITRLANNSLSFVADDLHDKIRQSTPGSNDPSMPGTPLAASVGIIAGPGCRGSLPPLDPTLLNDIERHARRLASNVDGLIESLTDALHGISALTVDCVETYRDTVCKTCDSVDANIKSMYQLMAKGEELSKSMAAIYSLHSQIKEVRRTLDILDGEMHSTAT